MQRLMICVLLTGCVGEPMSFLPDQPSKESATDVIQIQYDGESRTRVCMGFILIPGPPCQGLDSGENVSKELDFPGKPLRIAGAIEWIPESSETEVLEAYLVEYPRATGLTGKEPFVRGPSPLEFDWDVSRYENKTFELMIDHREALRLVAASLHRSVSQNYEVHIQATVALS